MKTFDEDFEYFWNRIFVDKTPTVFARYADGEVCLIKGRAVGPGSQATNIDNWSAPNELTILGIDIAKSLTQTDPNYFYAISCTCCDKTNKDILERIIKNKDNITFANLWINYNYNKFKSRIQTIKEKVYLIGNESGSLNSYPFDVVYIPVEKDCVNFWKNNKLTFLSNLKNKLKDVSNPLVLAAAGPMTEAILDKLWKYNPNGRYIDIGSALDEYIFCKKTREYMNKNSPFNNRICTN
jgi:hypothetical protein